MTLLFGLASTPGRAGEAASLQFVGYKHGNYYCQSREGASYYNCGYYKVAGCSGRPPHFAPQVLRCSTLSLAASAPAR